MAKNTTTVGDTGTSFADCVRRSCHDQWGRRGWTENLRRLKSAWLKQWANRAEHLSWTSESVTVADWNRHCCQPLRSRLSRRVLVDP
jgi:hypothetical protein